MRRQCCPRSFVPVSETTSIPFESRILKPGLHPPKTGSLFLPSRFRGFSIPSGRGEKTYLGQAVCDGSSVAACRASSRSLISFRTTRNCRACSMDGANSKLEESQCCPRSSGSLPETPSISPETCILSPEPHFSKSGSPFLLPRFSVFRLRFGRLRLGDLEKAILDRPALKALYRSPSRGPKNPP